MTGHSPQDPGPRYRIASMLLLVASGSALAYLEWGDDDLSSDTDVLLWVYGRFAMFGMSLCGIAGAVVLYVLGLMVSSRWRREAEAQVDSGPDPG